MKSYNDKRRATRTLPMPQWSYSKAFLGVFMAALVLRFLILGAFAQGADVEVRLTPKQVKKLEELKKKQEASVVAKSGKKSKWNKFLKVTRSDQRLINVSMSTNDSISTLICYGQPIKLVLSDNRKLFGDAGISENQHYFSAVTSDDKKSVIISLKTALEYRQAWRGRVYVTTKGSTESYVINLTATYCPDGEPSYPVEIRIHEIDKDSSVQKEILNPEDHILSLTRAFPRVNRYRVNIGTMTTISNYDKISQPIEIHYEPSRKCEKYFANLDRGLLEDPSLEGECGVDFSFIFLDDNQIQQFSSKTKILKYPTQFKTKEAMQKGLSTRVLRYNSVLSLSKKYIRERKRLHLLLVDEKNKSYQHLIIPVLKSLERLRESGIEL